MHNESYEVKNKKKIFLIAWNFLQLKLWSDFKNLKGDGKTTGIRHARSSKHDRAWRVVNFVHRIILCTFFQLFLCTSKSQR